MKLLRFGPAGREKPGCLDDGGVIRDLSGVIGDFSPDTLTRDTLAALAQTDLSGAARSADDVRIGACIGGARNFYAVGAELCQTRQ